MPQAFADQGDGRGADFVFSGRAILYGVAAGGLAGASRSFDILRDELDRTMGQIGRVRIDELDRTALTL